MTANFLKYSLIRKFINLQVRAGGFIEGAPALTHYLQNINEPTGKCYFEASKSLLLQLSDSGFDYRLPLEYDVPFPPVKDPKFTFIDLFAGIGGFRIALEKSKGKCVFTSEWDKFAQRTYEANFGEVPFGDITKIPVEMIPEHDVLVGGFPCQPFSIAGVSKKNALGRNHGFLDKTQGTLFFDIARIIEAKRPKAFLLENVKNLKSHDGGNTFRIIEESLKGLGYWVFERVLDAKYYVPQHRERIFIVGFDKEVFTSFPEFSFPKPPGEEKTLRPILEENPDPKYTLTNNLWVYLQEYARKHKAKGNGFGFGLTNPDGISRTLSARYYKDGSEILIPMGKGKIPRRLTPEECKNLMGFPKEFNIKDIGVSDTQLYKQFGNSVAVPLASDVAESLGRVLKTKIKTQTKIRELA
jgi:DNA (cytosine-5)-methyltransferase 1